MKSVLVPVLAALMLAACGTPGAGPRGGDRAGTGGGASQGPLVVFSRSGGFAGFQDNVLITPAGKVQVTGEGRGRRFVLDRGGLDRLVQTLGAVDWSVASGDHTGSGPAVSDGIIYKLRYGGYFATGYGVTPSEKSLRPALSLMQDLIEGERHTQSSRTGTP